MKTKTYAQLRAELDALLESFNTDDIDVDEAMVAYEKAVKLQAEIQDYLKKAENKIKKLH